MAMNSRMIPNSSIYSRGEPTGSRTTPVVCQTRVPRNPNMERLQSGYLFPKIEMKRNAYMQKYPDAKLINLGVGDTTEPIPKIIASTMAEQCYALSTYEGYLGYGPEAGNTELRDVIAKVIYKDTGISGGEVFISDGAQSDIARVQLLFGSNVTMAVQDPSFPAYIDCGVMMGQSGEYIPNTGSYQKFEYMKCTPENDFFPDLSIALRTDVIFFCSPNNPTGHAASKEQLEQLVGFARSNGSIIVIDTAYSAFISDVDRSPKSIYEIPGSKEVAIEISSFSKFAGFTGVRLGWTVVPKELRYLNNFQVIKDFDRVVCTSFNGASQISQAGGLACLSPKGNEAIHDVIKVYRQNTQVLAYALKMIGVETYGGKNSPYVWAHFPGRKSWDVFNELLNEAQVITIPGIGFGPGGEGFIRFSAFSRTKDVHEACRRLEVHFNK